MPLYFFDIADGGPDQADDTGLAYDSVTEACDAAVRALPRIAHDMLARDWSRGVRGEDEQHASISVRNGAEGCLFKVTMTYHTEWTH